MIENLKGLPTVYVIGDKEKDGLPSNRDIDNIKQLRELSIDYVYTLEINGQDYINTENIICKQIGNLIENYDFKGNWQIPIMYRFFNIVKDWYENTNEEYFLFCENDVDFTIAKYWSFTFEDFIKKLPVNWNYVQLTEISENTNMDIKVTFKNKYWHYWGNQALLIHRRYAEYICNYIENENYIFDNRWINTKFGASEFILQAPVPGAYTFPLFIERFDFRRNRMWHIGSVNSFLSIRHFWRNNKEPLEYFFK